jgi:hypothetical protein
MWGEVVIAYYIENLWHLPGDWRNYEITPLKFEGSKNSTCIPICGTGFLGTGGQPLHIIGPSAQ